MKMLNQTNIEIIKDPDLEKESERNTLEFIDQKYIEAEVFKAAQRMKSFIQDEIRKSQNSSLVDQSSSAGISKDQKIINILENQILFLEEENRRKNDIIETLLQGHKAQSCCCSEKSVDSNSNRCNVKINASSDLSDHITTRKHKEKVNVKSISSQTNTMESKKSHLSPIKSADKKDQKKEKRETVYICGDSLLNGIDGDGVSTKDVCTVVKSFGGSTSRDMVDYIKPAARKKPDKIIVHVGTNDISKNIEDSTTNWQIIIDTVNEISPGTSVIFSELCLRNDLVGGFTKVKHKNEALKKFCSDRNIGLVEHGNIDNSCLAKKKLHMNQKGLKRLALNFKSFLGKC